MRQNSIEQLHRWIHDNDSSTGNGLSIAATHLVTQCSNGNLDAETTLTVLKDIKMEILEHRMEIAEIRLKKLERLEEKYGE